MSGDVTWRHYGGGWRHSQHVNNCPAAGAVSVIFLICINLHSDSKKCSTLTNSSRLENVLKKTIIPYRAQDNNVLR